MPPKVSVIIPIYNAQEYLRTCLDSIRRQTLYEIEIICVDDGSTDSSMSIIQEYSSLDSRIIVLSSGQNTSAGEARNLGMKYSSGEYLSFLDADDFFDDDMLEAAYLQAKKHDTDIVLFDADLFSRKTQEYTKVNWILNRSYLPSKLPFCSYDIPDWIFLVSSPAPWNKLFRNAFVQEQKLHFQAIHSSNDVYFSMISLVCARRITVVERILMHYSIDNPTSLQGSQTKNPMDVYYAFLEIKRDLEIRGIYATFERSYINKTLFSVIKAIQSIKSLDAFEKMHSFLINEGFYTLGIDQKKASFFLAPLYSECYRRQQKMKALPANKCFVWLRNNQNLSYPLYLRLFHYLRLFCEHHMSMKKRKQRA